MTRAWPWLLLATSRHPYTRPLIILASIFRHTFLRVLSFLHLPPTSSISQPELSLYLSVTKTHTHSLSLSLSLSLARGAVRRELSATRQRRQQRKKTQSQTRCAFFLKKQGRCCPSSVSMGAELNNAIPLILNLRFFIHNP
jgi:hypothetical protein